MRRALLPLLALLLACAIGMGVASTPRLGIFSPRITAEPILRRPDSPRVIEWRFTPKGELDTTDSSLALLIHVGGHKAPTPKLITFDGEVSVGEVLKSSVPRELLAHTHRRSRSAPRPTCQLVDGEKRSVDEYASLAKLLQKEQELSLECYQPTAVIASDERGQKPSQQVRRHSWKFVRYTAPNHRPNEVAAANLLHQTLTGEMREYPNDSMELISETWTGVMRWVSAWVKHHWGPLHPYPDYKTSTQNGRWHANNGRQLKDGEIPAVGPESEAPIRFSLAADWGAGTRESEYVAKQMLERNGSDWKPHWTLHIGDIYYVGADEEVRSNCLGEAPEGVKKGVTWPHGSLGSFAVQGNHEMYARGYGFFDTFLPSLGVKNKVTGKVSGQDAGYVALENAHWRVILLDTGYHSYSVLKDDSNTTQPDAVIDWLVNDVKIGNPDDTRGIIIMTHHQSQSAFDEPHLPTPIQVSKLVPPERTILWLYGHEHRVAFYKQFTVPNSTLHVHARCMGNSGFPASVADLPARAREAGLMAYDNRLYRVATGFFDLPVSYNGWVQLTLTGRTASLLYSTLASDPYTNELSDKLHTDLVEEVFQLDPRGNVMLSSFALLNPNMTIITHE